MELERDAALLHITSVRENRSPAAAGLPARVVPNFYKNLRTSPNPLYNGLYFPNTGDSRNWINCQNCKKIQKKSGILDSDSP